ncbi:hypothetical protein SUGI_0206510 [Cryptomeria japonica]|nr:hypothetical protein SUGI_0206510 [Cryptomeria japonica]
MDMGRAIAGDESRDPSKCSRVWKSNEAYQALQRNLVLHSVQSIYFSGSEQTACNAFFQKGGKDRIRYCRRINACNANAETEMESA